MKVSELFALPLRVVPHNSDPNWGAGIAEADDHVWVISVNPRTTGGFSPKLLVSAQERAEAIVAAVNERDEMGRGGTAENAIADLRKPSMTCVVERIAAWSQSHGQVGSVDGYEWHEVHQNTGESFRDRWKRHRRRRM
jgi:hypothetical protein